LRSAERDGISSSPTPSRMRASAPRKTWPASAAQVAPHLGGDLRVGPAGGDHLLQDAHVPGRQILLQVVAGLHPALPQRLRLREHRLLAGEQFLVLEGEQSEEETALGAEVIVDLAERHTGLVGDLAGGEPRDPVALEAALGRLEEERGGLGPVRAHEGIFAREAEGVRFGIGASIDTSRR